MSKNRLLRMDNVGIVVESLDMALSSLVKWFSMKTCIGSAIFAAMKDFSSDWLNNSTIKHNERGNFCCINSFSLKSCDNNKTTI